MKIKDLDFLNEFQDTVNFQVIDLLDIDSSYGLGSEYEVQELDLVVGNYLMDVFPTIPVKFSNKNLGEIRKITNKNFST